MVELNKINEYIWEIPKSDGMNVPGRIFSSEKLIEDVKKDKALEQVSEVAKLPGILNYSIACPDVHQGYGFPIGGVAGFDVDKGVVSPAGVGYDINCSVRLLKTNLSVEDLEGVGLKKVMHKLFNKIPTGTGKGGIVKISSKELDELLIKGVKWCVDKGYATKWELDLIEENGCIKGGDVKDVSKEAKARGINQLGSLGSGNHFLEFQVVEEVIDSKVGEVFGLKKGQVVIMIHCGSRGLGHQVASDYIKNVKECGCGDLGYFGIKSDLGRQYISAMNCAANFAFVNKQIITWKIREVLKDFFGDVEIDLLYDICHNIAKFEKHEIDGKMKEIFIIRKGATRSFGPGREEIPEKYRGVGQPIFIPGSMGTSSYVLVGTKKAEELTFGSTAHGAGRVMSRGEALKTIKVGDVRSEMDGKGIVLEAGSPRGIVEEAPLVYKDVDEVVRVSSEAGIGKVVARLLPLGVIKG